MNKMRQTMAALLKRQVDKEANPEKRKGDADKLRSAVDPTYMERSATSDPTRRAGGRSG